MKCIVKGLLPALMISMLLFSCSKEQPVSHSDKKLNPTSDYNAPEKFPEDELPAPTKPGQGLMILNTGNGNPCVKAPSWCYSDIANHAPLKLNTFIQAIDQKTYTNWLWNLDNFNFLVEIFPAYKDHLIDCKNGTRDLVILWNNEEKVGILIGYQNASAATSYTNHEASMVLYK